MIMTMAMMMMMASKNIKPAAITFSLRYIIFTQRAYEENMNREYEHSI
jgi:hypothetical protein